MYALWRIQIWLKIETHNFTLIPKCLSQELHCQRVCSKCYFFNSLIYLTDLHTGFQEDNAGKLVQCLICSETDPHGKLGGWITRTSLRSIPIVAQTIKHSSALRRCGLWKYWCQMSWWSFIKSFPLGFFHGLLSILFCLAQVSQQNASLV